VLHTNTCLEKMVPTLEEEGIFPIDMRLEAAAVALERCTEQGDAWNEHSGSARALRALHGSALRKLEAQAVHPRPAEGGGQCGIHAVVGHERRSSRAPIRQLVRVEGIVHVARVGEGVSHHKILLRSQHSVQPSG